MNGWDVVARIYEVVSKKQNAELSQFGLHMIELIENLQKELDLNQVRTFTEAYNLVLHNKTSGLYLYVAWDDGIYKISQNFFVDSESVSEDQIISRIKAYLEA